MNTNTIYRSLSDLHLLELLCSEENDEIIYGEFVKRFLPELLAICEKRCEKRKLDLHVGKQIAHETFERVRKYKSFKKDKITLSDNRKAIVVYLIRISISLFNDKHNKEKVAAINHRTYFDDLMDSVNPKVDLNELRTNKDIAEKLFKGLNKKEQQVILTDIEHKKHHKYLPDNINLVLSQQLGVKIDSVRKIRERAIEKLKKGIDEINQS